MIAHSSASLRAVTPHRLPRRSSRRLDARPRRDLLRAPCNRRRQDDRIALMPEVGEQQFRADRIGEIRFARDQRLQRIAVAVKRHEFGVEALLAIIAALECREYRSNAGSAMRHPYPDLVHVQFPH